MMTTYWDLSDKERAELSADDVRRYLDAELMTKGVLKVRPLDIEPEPVVPEPSHVFFSVGFSRGPYTTSDPGVVFATIEAARAFIALAPLHVESTYTGGDYMKHVEDVCAPEIREVKLFTKDERVALLAELTRANAVKGENTKRRTEHAESVKAQDKALEGLWEDWSACRTKRAKLRAVADTFADYKTTAGDDITASKFLAKVYDGATIAEARDWFGFPVVFEDFETPAPAASVQS